MPEQTRKKEREQHTEQQVARRHDPFTPSLMPSDLFNMNPFSLMRRMHEEMDRIFAESMGGGRAPEGQQRGLGMWSPAIEIRQREGNLVVCAELPGIRKDDIKIEVREDALVLEGERKQEQEGEEGGVRRSERSYGRFYRMISLPEGANTENAHASFKDGVLEIKIPVQEPKSRARNIQIESGT
jgi:HSP20 family protein